MKSDEWLTQNMAIIKINPYTTTCNLFNPYISLFIQTLLLDTKCIHLKHTNFLWK